MKKISYTAITQLFLNDNNLQTLPSDFFLAFPRLQWLDLRNNKLEKLFVSECSFRFNVCKKVQYYNILAIGQLILLFYAFLFIFMHFMHFFRTMMGRIKLLHIKGNQTLPLNFQMHQD